MKTGAAGDDAYLAEWRKSKPIEVDGDAEEVAKSEAERINIEYDQERIKSLITNDAGNNFQVGRNVYFKFFIK